MCEIGTIKCNQLAHIMYIMDTVLKTLPINFIKWNKMSKFTYNKNP